MSALSVPSHKSSATLRSALVNCYHHWIKSLNQLSILLRLTCGVCAGLSQFSPEWTPKDDRIHDAMILISLLLPFKSLFLMFRELRAELTPLNFYLETYARECFSNSLSIPCTIHNLILIRNTCVRSINLNENINPFHNIYQTALKGIFQSFIHTF